MEHTIDVACFTTIQEIQLCRFVVLVIIPQQAWVLTGSVIALTVLSQSKNNK